MNRKILYIGPIIVLLSQCVGSEKAGGPDLSLPNSPEEELATFHMEDGLEIQLVASEPMVQDPVVISFDERGRLWVVEMRGFMPNLEGRGEDQPVGRVSVLEDTDADGRMDVSTIYLDSLIMPRALAIVQGGALLAENGMLWFSADADGDLRADSKIVIDSSYAREGNPEHSANGLWRNIDNWYYNAKSRWRYRPVNGKWLRELTEFRGQWGLSHDDEGRLFYNYNWSQLHADLVPPNYLSGNKNHAPTTGIDHGLTLDRKIYPIRSNRAVNRGYIPGTLDENGRLREFTAACSPFYYRGHALKKDHYGNVFVCEPSGNLIKRNVVEEHAGWLSAYDPHPGKEFVASTDERFRPVHLASGPDGALYVADMYRGLVQHGAYVTPYLREQTLKRKLDQPIHYGRIWRITAKAKSAPAVDLASKTSIELVAYLSHSNGWHRDMAQRLLVERNDRTIVEALNHVAASSSNDLARLHALWTLEGMNALEGEVLFRCMDDTREFVRTAAMRLLETQATRNENIRNKLGARLIRQVESAGMKEVLQIALTARSLRLIPSLQILTTMATRFDTSALVRDAIISSIENEEFALLQTLLSNPEWQNATTAREIFIEMLSSAILNKGDGDEALKLLSNIDRDPENWQNKALITAMSVQAMSTGKNPIRLAKAPPFFERHKDHPAGSIFVWPGKSRQNIDTASVISLNDRDRRMFISGRTHYLTNCSGCHGTDGAGLRHLGPTLIGSEWVLGDARRLALLVLHGVEGPIRVNGKLYDKPEILPVMPSHSTIDDAELSAILTYIRNEWGNQAGPVPRGLVGTTRHTTQGRVMPWKADELNEFVERTNNSN